MTVKTALTIAGSDPSGGAGLQADLKTFAAHGIYGMSAVTALTVQNTEGVKDVMPLPCDFFESQLENVLWDIPPDTVKTGMMPNSEIIRITAELLKKYRIGNIVIDTVMVSTSGRRLMDEKAFDDLCNYLIPVADVMTPNIPEAELFFGQKISDTEDMHRAALYLCRETGGGVLIKGGHLRGAAEDILCYRGEIFTYKTERINNPNTHGTGCTLSSAIACGLAAGLDLPRAVGAAKEYISRAIGAGLELGHGNGPLMHNV